MLKDKLVQAELDIGQSTMLDNDEICIAGMSEENTAVCPEICAGCKKGYAACNKPWCKALALHAYMYMCAYMGLFLATGYV